MLTLEQVKLLDSKVESLIEMVKSLTRERELLHENVQKKDAYIAELESKVSTYEAEQAKIEECVGNTLGQLNLINALASHSAVQSSPISEMTEVEHHEANDVLVSSEGDSVDSSSNSYIPTPELKDEENQQSAEADESDDNADQQMAIF